MLKNRLKERRNECRMTQVELAEKAGISRATISKIENNEEVNLTTQTIAKLSEVLGVNPSDIFLF